MNEYDPMKDNSSQYTNPSHDGQRYTNPDGSHGFIYTPNEREYARKHRRYRSTIVVLAVTVGALVVTVCCLAGGYMAGIHLLPPVEAPEAQTGESTDDAGTSGGLFISDETESDGAEGNLLTPNRPGGNNAVSNDDIDGTAPPLDSIQKNPAERTDTDGDGRADTVLDENGHVITSAGEDRLPIPTVINRVAASVVEIITETVTQSGYLGQYVSSGAGSGVIISGDGYIVTNDHVVSGANTITVRLNDGTEFPATLVGTDERTDVAVIRIQPGSKKLTVATLGASFDLVAGEDVIAIGNPLGSLGGTVTEGMISATARQIQVSGNVMTLLQVSVPINPGNSGGGLFNLAGELVGVVNAKISQEEIEGIGFAIPIDTAYEVILELIHYGYVRGRPTLDFTVVDVTSYQMALRYFQSYNTGVYVYDNSHSVVKYGDLVLSADGVAITSTAELNSIVQRKAVGDTLELKVYRRGKETTLTVTVTEYIPDAMESAS